MRSLADKRWPPIPIIENLSGGGQEEEGGGCESTFP